MTPLDADLRDRLRAVRLCAFDVDGTLLDERHEITPATRAAVDSARTSGLVVVLASSRSPEALRAVLAALDLSGPFIASQGAVTGRFADGPRDGRLEILDHQPAPLSESLEVLELAAAAGVSVSWHTPDRWLVLAEDPAVVREARITGGTPTVLDRSDLTVGPDKLMLVADPEDTGAIEAVAAAVPAGLQAQFSNPTYLEVTATGIDKGSALSRLCARLGTDLGEVLAVGDGPNDLAMLRTSGVSAAPANARPEVRSVVDVVCAAHDRGGVAELLDALVALRTA